MVNFRWRKTKRAILERSRPQANDPFVRCLAAFGHMPRLAGAPDGDAGTPDATQWRFA